MLSKRSLLTLLLALPCLAADSESPVQTLFAAKCQMCHNDRSSSSGLSLASIEGIKKGGKRGPAIISGKPDESLLYQLVSGGKPAMPFGGEPLSKDQIATIRQWIEQGAPWAAPKLWWSLQPLVKPSVPATNSPWVKTPIDAFVLAKLHEKGMEPSPEADKRTLIRRLTFDLHGLPPAPEEVDAFVADASPDAYEKLVDRLLGAPHYGERWGRHWLDAAHYGETHGYDKDKPRPNAWPYRDYVIQAFNQDKPYARFVQEQLAADVLFPEDPSLIPALGYLASGPWDLVGQTELREGTTDKKITRLLDRDDIVTLTMSTLESMTAHCARCHNHKFDPIAQADYYSLQSVFSGIDRADRAYDGDRTVYAKRKALLAQRRGLTTSLRVLDDEADQVTTPEIEALDKQVAQWQEISANDPEKRPLEIKKKIADAKVRRAALVKAALPAHSLAEMGRLESEIKALDSDVGKLPKPHLVYAASSYFEPQGTFRYAVDPRPVHVLARGSVDNPGDVAPPGALSCIPGLRARFEVDANAPEGARRAAFARWVTDPKNVLAWRSIVNRVWHYHFGAGIVDSPNDFGRMGSLPSNRELLDWLAVEFRDNGGSFKRLHKMIVMSSVYRQSSAGNENNARIDSDNRLLWRANRQRLDAESLRDAILSASGKLDLTMGGPSVRQFFFKDDHSPVYDYTRFDPDDPANNRRSIYRFMVRSVPDPLMERFDCPDVSMVTPKRTTTITAIQALALMNNPFVLKQVEHLAARVRQHSEDPTAQIAYLYRVALQRRASAKEASILKDYLAREGMENLCRLVLNTNEFLFID